MPLSDPQTWVEQYGDVLFRYAVARLRNPSLAEDVVQETFLAALQSSQRFQEQSSERTWLVGILKHKLIDALRRASREQATTLLDSLAAEPDEQFDEQGRWKIGDADPHAWDANPRLLLQQQEFLAVLDQCLAGLSPRLAHAFVLRELDDVSTKQICQVLGVTPTNVWIMLHRARAQLRKCLERRWFDQPSSR